MTYELKVPPAGDSITSATIGQWHFGDGDFIEKDAVVVTLETDKVAHELQAEVSGELKIKVEEGTDVDIGQIIGLIEEKKGASNKKSKSQKDKKDLTDSESLNETEKIKEKKTSKSSDYSLDSSSDLVVKEKRDDSEQVVLLNTPDAGNKKITRKKMTQLRRKIASHLVNAQNQSAILTTFNECDMTEIINARKKHQEYFQKTFGVKLGFMSFFLKAVTLALRDVPGLNAQIDGDYIIENNYYDVGVAVGTEKGLFVPVIRGCDEKSFSEIEKEIIHYANKAKDGKISFEDLSGGVFTITNGGIYGSLLSTPIINPPQSGILGMHTIQKRPVVVDGEIVIRPMMYLALSYDHRLVDGKEAVTFLIQVKKYVENPLLMVFS